MIWIVIAGVLLLLLGLLLLPVVVEIRYDQALTLALRYGFLRFQLFPKKKKEKKKPNNKSKPNAKQQDAPSPGGWKNLVETYGVVGAVEKMIDAAKGISKAAYRLLKGARIRNMDVTLRVAGKDAAEAAVNYGKVCSLVYPFLGAVDRYMKFVRPQLDLTCDYEQERSLLRGQASIHISLYHGVGTGLYLLKELIKSNMKIKVVK